MRSLLAVAAVVLPVLCAARASAIEVRVRGGASLEARARFLGGTARPLPDGPGGEEAGSEDAVLELHGVLSDEEGAPIEDTWLELRAASGFDLADASGCPRPRVSVAPLPGGLRVQTGSGGEFCLRWRDPPARGSLSLRFGGDRYHGAAEISQPFDRAAPRRLATRLRFEPPLASIDLDGREVIVTALLSLERRTSEGHAAVDLGERPVELEDDGGRHIASARTGGDGKARFSVAPSRFGAPGAGKLVVRFDGDLDLAPARAEQSVTRFSTVVLSAEPPSRGARGGEVVLEVSAAASGGEVDGGVVEALVAGQSRASALVARGKALLRVPIDADASEAQAVVVRYLPSTPYHRSGRPLALTIPIAPPSPILRGALLLVVAAAATWVFSSWRRSRKLPAPRPKPTTLPPGVHVVDDGRRPPGRWSGLVVDAHDGVPLAEVAITVRIPSLTGDGVVARLESGADGTFELDLRAGSSPDAIREAIDGLRIEAESASHARESRELSGGGRLTIALVTRRRALIDRFVRWARRRGLHLERAAEPTPADIRAASQDADVRRWADDVEAAAFGPAPVDAAVEHDLRHREPPA